MKSPGLVSINRIIAIQLLIIAVLHPPPAASQPSPPPPPWVSDHPSTYNGIMNPRVGLVVLVATVIIFFTAFCCLFARSCCRDESSISLARLSTVQRGNRGLNPDAIDSFPKFDYSAVKALKNGKGALECAVCLNEFEDDETLRLIPKCDHLFHADCIDMWLASHATCPVCRAYLVPDPGESINAGNQSDAVAINVAEVLQPATTTASTQSGGGTGEWMEQPLNPPWLIRSRTRGSLNRWSNASGRRRWFGLFARSHSTGHVAVASENTERFTLRVPEEVRRQIISGKLSRTTSCIAPSPTEGSSRRGNRIGLGSGQSLNY